MKNATHLFKAYSKQVCSRVTSKNGVRTLCQLNSFASCNQTYTVRSTPYTKCNCRFYAWQQNFHKVWREPGGHGFSFQPSVLLSCICSIILWAPTPRDWGPISYDPHVWSSHVRERRISLTSPINIKQAQMHVGSHWGFLCNSPHFDGLILISEVLGESRAWHKAVLED